jgi:hypothetical protein
VLAARYESPSDGGVEFQHAQPLGDVPIQNCVLDSCKQFLDTESIFGTTPMQSTIIKSVILQKKIHGTANAHFMTYSL